MDIQYTCRGRAIFFGTLTWVFGPFWLLSRILTFIYPIFIVIYLNARGISFYNDIDLFQLIMFHIYTSLIVIILILLGFILYEQYYLWHIMPVLNRLPDVISVDVAIKFSKRVETFYDSIVIVPIRESIIIDVFGPDIGNIINQYIPKIEDNEQVIASFTSKFPNDWKSAI